MFFKVSKMLLATGVVAAVSGCAHTAMRGTVAMKVDPDEAHVCLGKDEVKIGDKVALFTQQCEPSTREKGGSKCKKVKVGEGQVTQLLNEHYSVIKINPGVPFQEGTVVEKL